MNVVFDSRPHTELSDVEIVADIYRLVRSGRRMTRAELTAEIEQLFPGLPVERLQRCCADLATRLEAQQS